MISTPTEERHEAKLATRCFLTEPTCPPIAADMTREQLLSDPDELLAAIIFHADIDAQCLRRPLGQGLARQLHKLDELTKAESDEQSRALLQTAFMKLKARVVEICPLVSRPGLLALLEPPKGKRIVIKPPKAATDKEPAAVPTSRPLDDRREDDTHGRAEFLMIDCLVRIAKRHRAIIPRTVLVLGKKLSDVDELRAALDGCVEDGLATTWSRRYLDSLALGIADEYEPPVAKDGSLGVVFQSLEPFFRVATSEGTLTNHLNDLRDHSIELFDNGSIGRAVTFLEATLHVMTGHRNLSRGRTAYLARVRRSLSLAKLGEHASKVHLEPALRHMMNLFPDLSAEAIANRLANEDSRIARKQLLALLRVHGATAQKVILSKLLMTAYDEREDSWYWSRNLALVLGQLLERHPEIDDVGLEAVISQAQPQQRFQVLRELIPCLGRIPGEQAGRQLRTLLHAFLARGRRATGRDRTETHQLVLQVIQELARRDWDEDRRVAVQALLEAEGYVASTQVVWRELAGSPLTRFPRTISYIIEQVDAIINARKPLLGASEEPLRSLIGLLTSTPEPRVAGLLARVLSHAKEEATREEVRRIQKGWSGLTSPEDQTRWRHKGSLKRVQIGLLLDWLVEERFTGTVSILSKSNDAELLLDRGRLVTAKLARLRGPAVVEALLNVRRAVDYELRAISPTSGTEPSVCDRSLELGPLLRQLRSKSREAIELEVLVPEELSLFPAVDPPPIPPWATDGILIRKIWGHVRTRTKIRACAALKERRARQLLRFWLDEGAVTQDPSVAGR